MKAAKMEPPDLPGLTFVRELGVGGFSSVFLYQQAMPKMKVAVKVLAAEGVSDSVRLRFTAEANAMAELADHPNIVPVFRADVTSDGRPYLVMKYYPQPNLAERSRSESIPLHEVLDIGIRVCCAVETAHRAGILHRDIKPANILTSQYDEPGLADFGIATSKTATGGAEADGMSIPWSPPEVLFGGPPSDERSDVYSLGATIWHLIEGRSPFEVPGGDNTSLPLMRRIREDPPPHVSRPDVPSSLDRLLVQTMAKDPASRPPSAVALARALQQIEIEQRWSQTPLVLPSDGDDRPGRRASDDDGEDRTRLRTPQRVVAQKSASLFAPEASQASGTAATTAAGGPSPDSEPTALRPQTVSHTGPQPSDPGPQVESAPSKGNRGLLATAAAVVVVAAVVGAILASGGHKGSSAQSSGRSGPDTTQDAVAAGSSPAAPSDLQGRVVGNQAEFTWTASQTGDTFRWAVPGGAATATSSASASVPYHGAATCLDVWEVSPQGAISISPATACVPSEG